MKQHENSTEQDYSRDVINDLKAISCCRHSQDPAEGCTACPLKRDSGRDCTWDLDDSIESILSLYSEEQAEHLLSAKHKCGFCDGVDCDETCPCYEESPERHPETFYRLVFEFLKSKGLYNADDSVSEKGTRIRVSDTLALLKATGLTEDSWPKDRGGLL